MKLMHNDDTKQWIKPSKMFVIVYMENERGGYERWWKNKWAGEYINTKGEMKSSWCQKNERIHITRKQNEGAMFWMAGTLRIANEWAMFYVKRQVLSPEPFRGEGRWPGVCRVWLGWCTASIGSKFLVSRFAKPINTSWIEQATIFYVKQLICWKLLLHSFSVFLVNTQKNSTPSQINSPHAFSLNLF